MSLEATAKDGQWQCWRMCCGRYEGRRPKKLGHRRLTAAYGGRSRNIIPLFLDTSMILVIVKRKNKTVAFFCITCRIKTIKTARWLPPANVIEICSVFLRSETNRWLGTEAENRSRDGQGKNAMLPLQHRLRSHKNKQCKCQ